MWNGLKRSVVRRVSKKHQAELRARKKLAAELLDECKGLCVKCGQRPDWRGLALAHTTPLSQGGKTERTNCRMWCGRCHSADHGIREV